MARSKASRLEEEFWGSEGAGDCGGGSDRLSVVVAVVVVYGLGRQLVVMPSMEVSASSIWFGRLRFIIKCMIGSVQFAQNWSVCRAFYY